MASEQEDLWAWVVLKENILFSVDADKTAGPYAFSPGETCPLITLILLRMQALFPTKCSPTVYLVIPFLCTASSSETQKAQLGAFSTSGPDYRFLSHICGSFVLHGDGTSVTFHTCKYLPSHVKKTERTTTTTTKTTGPQISATHTNFLETKPRFWTPSRISLPLPET